MKTNHLALSFSWLILTVLLSSCQPMQAISPGAESEFLFDTTVKVDENCLSSEEYDACLFVKNPVHHQGSSFASKPSNATDLSSQQTAGVQIFTQSSTGLLENINIKVISEKHPSVKQSDSQWKYLHDGSDSWKFEQVSAYYWLSHVTQVLEERTGNYWGKGQQILVHLDDSHSGYSPESHSIHLQSSTEESSLALSTEVLVYYLGLANLHQAGQGQIQDVSADQDHIDCGTTDQLKKSYCCRSENGCSRALASGAAEYLVAMTFPEAPTIGESWVNRSEGLKICSLSRDLRKNSELTTSQAHQACSTKSMSGHPVALGTVYASIWWQVRKRAGEISGTFEEKDIDQLYQQHLVKIDGADNFSSVFAKILSTDRDLFGGRYSDLFREEFLRRGIEIQ